MKSKYLSFVVLILAIIGVILISGCVQQAESVCGNGIIEAGEECDSTDCPTGKVCTENCKCEIPEIPSPPALPE